jgi:hypothetical protein
MLIQSTDDLPVIRKNIEQGFKETQSTVTKWITDFRKKIEGDEDTEEAYDRYGNPVPQQSSSQQRQNFGPSQSDQLYGIRKSAEQRRSADRERYDTDNRVLGDDFEALELRDEEGISHHSLKSASYQSPLLTVVRQLPHLSLHALLQTQTSLNPPPSLLRRPAL